MTGIRQRCAGWQFSRGLSGGEHQAARHVSARIWSPDQKIRKTGKGKTLLYISTSSKPELMSQVLSFEDEMRFVKPEWLAGKVAEKIGNMFSAY